MGGEGLWGGGGGGGGETVLPSNNLSINLFMWP